MYLGPLLDFGGVFYSGSGVRGEKARLWARLAPLLHQRSLPDSDWERPEFFRDAVGISIEAEGRSDVVVR